MRRGETINDHQREDTPLLTPPHLSNCQRERDIDQFSFFFFINNKFKDHFKFYLRGFEKKVYFVFFILFTSKVFDFRIIIKGEVWAEEKSIFFFFGE